MSDASLVPSETIQSKILVLRGVRVLLDRDLAALYGVTTKRFKEQVRRNLRKFPLDFMFELTEAEKSEVAAKCGHLRSLKFSPVLPYAFTEHGAIQAANIVSSDIATEMSVQVVRAFVRLRQLGGFAFDVCCADLDGDGVDEILTAGADGVVDVSRKNPANARVP